jgi:hypothetical protein
MSMRECKEVHPLCPYTKAVYKLCIKKYISYLSKKAIYALYKKATYEPYDI